MNMLFSTKDLQEVNRNNFNVVKNNSYEQETGKKNCKQNCEFFS